MDPYIRNLAAGDRDYAQLRRSPISGTSPILPPALAREPVLVLLAVGHGGSFKRDGFLAPVDPAPVAPKYVGTP